MGFSYGFSSLAFCDFPSSEILVTDRIMRHMQRHCIWPYLFHPSCLFGVFVHWRINCLHVLTETPVVVVQIEFLAFLPFPLVGGPSQSGVAVVLVHLVNGSVAVTGQFTFC